jgi:POT family proton-dependent oligopeptide transporter
MNSRQLTDYLWNTYNPSKIWIIYSGMAVAASVLLFLYDRFILKGREVNGK